MCGQSDVSQCAIMPLEMYTQKMQRKQKSELQCNANNDHKRFSIQSGFSPTLILTPLFCQDNRTLKYKERANNSDHGDNSNNG